MLFYCLSCTVIISTTTLIGCGSRKTIENPTDIVPEELLEIGLIGGTPTEIKKFPFLVSIQKLSIPRCVGSLITASWVLTAAHCLVDLNRKTIFMLDPYEFTLISGRTVMASGTMEGQERSAEMFIIHSRFQRPYLKYDVGVILTTKPFVLGPTTQPVELYTMPPEVITFFPSCTLIGWNTGKHSFDDYEGPDLKPNSMKLEMMELKLMSSAQCKAILRGLISMDSVCTYLEEQCPGQSGSPLICGESLFGIFSWTAGCTNSSLPAIFVRVAKIYIWVHNVTHGQYIESFRKRSSLAEESGRASFNLIYLLNICILPIVYW
ncbi:trypsin 3A1-like [Coccinella septempunctata]|uniref:trypsin 3A1-like n=1 Tax=Coccinella septempunctata TaxID=41139 RepID=UPI001D0606E6|nr:trypsin 3A1-like [Coccinella septempunctata]